MLGVTCNTLFNYYKNYLWTNLIRSPYYKMAVVGHCKGRYDIEAKIYKFAKYVYLFIEIDNLTMLNVNTLVMKPNCYKF